MDEPKTRPRSVCGNGRYAYSTLSVEAVMRVIVATFAGSVALVTFSVQAAPLPPVKADAIELSSAPPIEQVRDDCGHGWHRTGWRDQWGRWQWGKCVPNVDPYRGQGAGWYSPPSYWRGTPPPWGWGWDNR
jgi:hypothetical protein